MKRYWIVGVLACLLALAACSSPEEKAQAHLENGLELLASEDFIKAGLEFRNAVRINDKLTEAWVGLSKVEERAQNWSGMNAALTKALELDPDHYESIVRLGKLELVAGNVESALKHLNKAHEINLDSSDVLAARAATLLRLNDREGARRDGERALALDKENTDAYAVLAAERIAEGDFNNAFLFLDRGLVADEKDLPLLLLKVRIFEQQKDDVKLEEVLRRLLSFYPDQVAFRRGLIAMLVSRGRLDEAEGEYRALAANDPENTQAALELVRFVARTKGVDAARTELEELQTAKPATIEYSLALAELEYGQKQVEEARSRLTAIIDKGEPQEDVQRARLLLVRMHLRQKETEPASKLIADVLSGDEKNADALALRASIRLDNNDVDNAITDLREALSQQTRSVPIMRLLGKALERQGSVELAEERYGQSVKQANFAPAITLEYIQFLGRRGKADKAEQVLTEAVGQNPNNRQLLTALARLRLNKQDWAGAEDVAQALKKLGDASGVSDQILGAAQLGQSKFEESVETFKAVYAQSRGATRPLLGITTSYVRAGKVDDAELFVDSVLVANPDNAEARVILGNLKRLQKKPEEAVAAFKEAIERQPENAVGYRALANQYISERDFDSAKEILQTGRNKAENDFAMGLTLASILEAQHDVEGAITIYEDLLKSRPNALIVANNLASLLADYRSDEESLKRASELSLLLKSTDLPHFRDTLGWVAYRNGDYAAALQYLKEAAEKLPKFGLVRYHLGMTHKALNQSEEARQELTKAMELSAGDEPLAEKVKTALADLPGTNSGD